MSQRLWRSGQLQGQVNTSAGLREDARYHIFAPRVDRNLRAKRPGTVQVCIHHIADQDLRRAQHPQPLHRHQANRTRPQHSHALTRREPAHFHRVAGHGRRLDQRAGLKIDAIRQGQQVCAGKVKYSAKPPARREPRNE